MAALIGRGLGSSVARSDARDAKTQLDGEQLDSLLRRVAAASGADRTLDGHIYGALGFDIIQRWGGFEWRPTGKGAWATMPSPTHSLDAALSLVARVLPGGFVGLQQNNRHGIAAISPWTAFLGLEDDEHEGFGPTPAIALLAALLRGLLSSEATPIGAAGEAEAARKARDEPKSGASQ